MVGDVCAAIAAIEKYPVGLARIDPAYMPEGDTGIGHLASLGADVLAFFAFQRIEKLVKVAIARIQPVKLDTASQQKTGLLQCFGLRRRWIQNMGGGGLAIYPQCL